VVAVVHQDRPGEIGEDEGFEGVQVLSGAPDEDDRVVQRDGLFGV
jgi:hypothetical protein